MHTHTHTHTSTLLNILYIVHTWVALNEHSQLYMQTNEYIPQHFRVTADNEVYLHN